MSGKADGSHVTSFGVLRNRSFAAYWASGTTSNVGTWLQNVTASVLILQFTGSVLMVGILGFISFLPLLVFSLPAGVIADRWDRRTIVVTTHLVASVAALAAAIGIALGFGSWFLVMAVAFTTHAAYSFAKPALVAMIPTLVDPEQLPAATAVATMQFMVGQLVGSVLASALLLAGQPAIPFLVNSLTFLAPVFAMRLIRSGGLVPSGGRTGRAALVEGLSYGWKRVSIRGALVAVLCIGAVAEFVRTLSPVIAIELFSEPASYAGLLVAALSIGSAIGLVITVRLTSRIGLGGIALLGLGLEAVGGALLFGSGNATARFVGIAIMGLGFASAFSAVTADLQATVPDYIRARIMSIHTLVSLGARPVASLLAGVFVAIAGLTGAALAVFSLVPCGIVSVLVLRRVKQRELTLNTV